MSISTSDRAKDAIEDAAESLESRNPDDERKSATSESEIREEAEDVRPQQDDR